METPPPEDHSFAPPNHKLITVYLRRRIAGEPLPSTAAAYFHDIDIYAVEPAMLTAGLHPLPAKKGEGSSWLFFTPVKTKSSTDSRRSRRVGGGIGTWHSEHAPESVVDDEGNCVGHRQLFSYKDKGGRRSGWSMWEFGAADQEGGQILLVLCKIHQAHTGSRRAEGSAARSSARKRKGTDDDVDKMASAPVKRRLFAPPVPTQPEDKIGATSETIRSCRTETEPLKDKIDAALEAIPSSRGQTEASKDTHVLSFWQEEELYLLHEDKISATILSSVRSFLPRPDASEENSISSKMESPASFLYPEPEAIPSSRTETEASKDAQRSVLSFWTEPCPSQQDNISEAMSSLGSFLPKQDASHENIISSTTESPASFFSPEPEASQGEMATFDCEFLMKRGVPPALEYCYNGSFTYVSNTDVSGVPLHAPGAEISDPWTGYDTMTPSCSVGNAFLGGFPTYGQFDAGASGSRTGYYTEVSCSDGKALLGTLPTYSEWGFSGSAYGCGMPSATFLPSAVPSQWCGAPGLWSC